jgi:hypothetical protein
MARQVTEMSNILCPNCHGPVPEEEFSKGGRCPHCGVDLGAAARRMERRTLVVILALFALWVAYYVYSLGGWNQVAAEDRLFTYYAGTLILFIVVTRMVVGGIARAIAGSAGLRHVWAITFVVFVVVVFSPAGDFIVNVLKSVTGLSAG